MTKLSDMRTVVFSLNMLSDWHVGSGYGRPGDIDALVARDEQDLPYVPAKTLTGILRDACEQTAFGLDNGSTEGPWSAWVTYIFGSQPSIEDTPPFDHPRGAALSIRPASLPDGICSRLTGVGPTGQAKEMNDALRQSLTFVKPGVMLNAKTGQSEDHCLRMVEMVRGGIALRADGQIDVTGLSSEQQHCVFALLAAGCRLTERIGGKRRRGSGRVNVSMAGQGIDEKSEVEWLATYADKIPSPPADTDKFASPVLHASGGDAGWSAFEVTLAPETPVIARSAKKGNVVESLDYLPGTYLLPAVSHALNDSGIDAATAIAGSRVLVSNATIDVNGQQGLPCPWAFFREKAPVAGTQARLVNTLRERLKEGRQYKGMRGGYVHWDGKRLASKSVEQTARMHNTIDDARQRPDDNAGGVFTYMAIRPGQTFRATIRVAADTAMPAGWERKLVGTLLRIGSSKKDDYGVVRIQDVRPAVEEHPAVRSDVLTVWMTSDLLLRNDRLGLDGTPEVLHAVLEKELGCELTTMYQPEEDGSPMNYVGRRRRTDSWQTGWGLPRPSLVGLCAGTCFIYKVASVQDEQRYASALGRLQQEGIGERRPEGYGQILFNSSLLDEKDVESAEVKSGDRPLENGGSSHMTDEEQEYWRSLESTLMTAELRKAATDVGMDAEKRRPALGITQKQPTDSQLGTLRTMAGVIKKPGDAVVMAWINHETGKHGKNKDLFTEKWGKDAKKRLTELFADQSAVWDLLFTKGTWQREFASTSKMDQDPKVWVEAVRTLLDQCIRFEKRDREKSAKQSKEGQEHVA
ncbi:MAG: RAMP superfamily CRISPR-associated protein [Candidatus Cryosericum sp.]